MSIKKTIFLLFDSLYFFFSAAIGLLIFFYCTDSLKIPTLISLLLAGGVLGGLYYVYKKVSSKF